MTTLRRRQPPVSRGTGVVIGWRWSASLDGLVCAYCVAMMDGSIHPVDEEMISHPNCRCAKAPVTRSWADLGIGDDDGEPMQTGEEWLREQDQETQERILGKAGRAAWLDGQFKLKDMIGTKEDDLLGEIGYRKSLIEILGEELADYYKRRVA